MQKKAKFDGKFMKKKVMQYSGKIKKWCEKQRQNGEVVQRQKASQLSASMRPVQGKHHSFQPGVERRILKLFDCENRVRKIPLRENSFRWKNIWFGWRKRWIAVVFELKIVDFQCGLCTAEYRTAWECEQITRERQMRHAMDYKRTSALVLSHTIFPDRQSRYYAGWRERRKE